MEALTLSIFNSQGLMVETRRDTSLTYRMMERLALACIDAGAHTVELKDEKGHMLLSISRDDSWRE